MRSPSGRPRAPARGGLTALLLRHPGSAFADVLAQSLGAAGVRVTSVTRPYDVLIAAERAPGPYRYVILGLDGFSRDEFRLLPILQREWPDSRRVVYHSAGFEYKARLAEFLGADLVLEGLDGISALLEALDAETTEPLPDLQLPPPRHPPEARPARAGRSRTAPSRPPHTEPPTPEEAEPPTPEEAEPADRSASGVAEPPIPAAGLHLEDAMASPLEPEMVAAGDDDGDGGGDGLAFAFDDDEIPEIELTDEELRILLAEEDEP